MSELKPVRCGCGGEAEIFHIAPEGYEGSYCVRCTKCLTQTPFFNKDKEKAITVWNRAMGVDRCCNTCDSYETGRYCLLWSIFCPSDHWCKDWSWHE